MATATRFVWLPRRTRPVGGIALLLVIVVLLMLILIAVPFSISMRVEKQVARNDLDKTRARVAALGAYNYGVAQLVNGCETLEALGQTSPYHTPDYDAPVEYDVNITLPRFNAKDPRGEIWSLRVEDEQGKVDVNSATPWLLGNLMGSALLMENALTTDIELVVDTTHAFAPAGGYLWVNGELIHYEKVLPNRFIGCQRGLYGDSPRFQPAQDLVSGTLVIDARAYRICQHRLLAKPGCFTPYRTVEEIRRIGDLGAYTIEPELFARLEPALTIYAGRLNAQGWIFGQKLRSNTGEKELGQPETLWVANTFGYRPGMTVKVSEGNQVAYGMIRGVSGQGIMLDTEFAQPFQKQRAMVAVLEAHPINLNSALPKVLFCLFKGLHTGSNWIGVQEATILTSAILAWRNQAGGIKSLEHFYLLLQQLQKELRDNDVRDEKNRPALEDPELLAILSAASNIAGLRGRFGGMPVPQWFDAYRTPWPPLASVVFRTNDTYTLEASAIINNPGGVPLADHTIRRVVTVAPPRPLLWKIATQQEFQFYLEHLPSWRVITWPTLVSHFDKLPQSDPKAENTGVSLDTVPLCPRVAQGAMFQQYYPWSHTYDGIEVPGNEQPRVVVRTSGLETAPAALSFWFYPLQAKSPLYLFDLGDKAGENRVACFHQDGELILQVFDTTGQNNIAEIAAPLSLEAQWYHLAVAWYTTGPGGLFLWIDGQPKGECRYRLGRHIQKARLTKALEPDAATVQLDNVTGLPDEGVIKIGDEAIEYDQILGNTLHVREEYEEFEQTSPGRGARGTTANHHPAGVAVTPFGYTDPLQTKVFPGTRLVTNVAEEGLFTEISMPLAATTTTIVVNSISHFPSAGYLLIADKSGSAVERVRYSHIGKKSFLGCRRGLLDTKPQEFFQAYVIPISIMVDDNSKYDDSGVVQIEQEWLTYERKIDQNLLLFYLPYDNIKKLKKTGELLPDYRGSFGTMSAQHNSGELVLPVFRTQFGWAGRGDQVTIIAENDPDQKETLTIEWAANNYAAFSQDVAREYVPGNGTRFIKFPSGELPVRLPQLLWGKSLASAGVTPFKLDEVQWLQTGSRSPYLLREALLPAGTTLKINSTSQLPHDGGICKVGDEYIGYSRIMPQDSLPVKRGLAMSTVQAHAAGTLVYPVFFVPATALTSPVTSSAPELLVADTRDFPAEGYLKCGEEIVGYSHATMDRFEMPMVQPNRGIWRGVFGTKSFGHDTGTMVYSLPVRYPDRVASGYDGSELAYFEAAKTAHGALWQKISWQEDTPATRYLGIRIRVRIDSKPAWEELPTNRKGGLFEFDDPQATNRLDVTGDTLELRVYFVYKTNAYSEGFWKSKALLKSLAVEYCQPLHVWEHRSE